MKIDEPQARSRRYIQALTKAGSEVTVLINGHAEERRTDIILPSLLKD
jgi:hypothetical protein